LKPKYPHFIVSYLLLILFLGSFLFVPTMRGQDFFPIRVPSDAQATKEMIEDVKNVDDIPGSDAAILYQELVSARNKMVQYRKFKTSVHQSDFDDQKKDFNDRLVALRNDAGKCDRQNSDDVHSSLLDLKGQDPFLFQTYPRTNRELSKMLSMKSEDLCRSLKSADLPVMPIRDQEIEVARKLSADQVTFANQIADAYQDRYRKLQKLSGHTSEATVLRITLLIIVVGVCLFAWLIFRGVTLFPEKLQSELIISGQLIQFPIVMILLVVVVVLGLSSILDDKTLGTLLGGIAGYVLSQGIGRAASRETERALSAKPDAQQGH
jgi:hypothetical protein